MSAGQKALHHKNTLRVSSVTSRTSGMLLVTQSTHGHHGMLKEKAKKQKTPLLSFVGKVGRVEPTSACILIFNPKAIFAPKFCDALCLLKPHMPK